MRKNEKNEKNEKNVKNKLKKILSTIYWKVLADEKERNLEKFQKKFGSSEKWLKSHKDEARNAIVDALRNAVDVALENFLKNGCKPFDKKINPDGNIIFVAKFDLFKNLQEFPNTIDSYSVLLNFVDPKLKDALSLIDKEIATISYLDIEFASILKKEGFEIKSHVDTFCLAIQWTVPFWYGVNVDKINWDDLYKSIQLYTYHKNLWQKHEHDSPAEEETEQYEKNMLVHDTGAQNAEDTVVKYLKMLTGKKEEDTEEEDKLIKAAWVAVREPYKEVIEDWYEDVAKFGEEPEHKIRLKKPPIFKSMGVEPE